MKFTTTATALTVVLASTSALGSLLTARHTPAECEGAEASSTRRCAVKAGECCPADWACVLPSSGPEVCIQNARGSQCPRSYVVGSQNVCVLVTTTGGTTVTHPMGTPTASTGGSNSGAAGSNSGAATPVTTVVTLTTTSLSTSFTVSDGSTLPVTVAVPVTTTSVATVLPSGASGAGASTDNGVTMSTSFSVSGSATIPVPIAVSTSLSVSGSATIPVPVAVTGSDSAGAAGATQPPNAASNVAPSLLAAFVGALAVVFA